MGWWKRKGTLLYYVGLYSDNIGLFRVTNWSSNVVTAGLRF